MSEKTKTKSSPSKAPHTSQEKTQFELVTPIPEQTDPKKFPFPEWSDDEISLASSSKTDHGGKSKDKADKSEKNEKADKIDKAEKKDKKEKSEDVVISFEDNQVLFLPFCLQEAEVDWKRPRDIFSEYHLVIFTDSAEYPDLLTDSSHLFHSSFMRSFVSSVPILEYLGNTTNFATEATTAQYVPNANGPWRPWHHIYSGGKIGAGTTHNPQVNSTGKYFVRLFWLGAWRKVTIDDYLPIDKTGHVLLPSLPIPRLPTPVSTMAFQRFSTVAAPPVAAPVKEKGGKHAKAEKEVQKPIVELWPFLLSKALLKLANMTMNKDKDMLHFDIIHCLSGWVLQNIDLNGVSADEMWEICKSYTKLYTWQHPDQEKEPTGRKKKGKKEKGKKKEPKVLTPNAGEKKHSHYFVALCRDMRSLKPTAVHGVSPCWGHEMIIDECRDLPLEEPPPNPEYPLWKKFRWTEWAKSKGLISDPIVLDTSRYVKCMSPFKQFSKLVVHKEAPPEDPAANAFPLRKSLNVLAKKLPDDTNLMEKKIEETPPEEKKSPRSDVSKGGKTKDKKKAVVELPPDPSIWVRFDELCPYLLKFNVFFRSSEFEHKARISDLELNEIMKKPGTAGKGKIAKTSNTDDGDTWQNVRWTNVVQERKNVPLYFFIDSLQSKMILINLSQAGDVGRLAPLEEELSDDNFFVEYERLFGERSKSSDRLPGPKKLKLNRARIHAGLKSSNLMFDEYRWYNAKTGEIVTFLSTFGDESTILELPVGRHILRVWVRSEFSFCITILADTRFTIGCLEQIIENMKVEPMQITQFSLDIAKSFADLISTFGTAQFANSLRRYYQSYLPKHANKELNKLQKCLIHSSFKQSLLNYLRFIQDFFTLQKSIDALRTIFLDPNIRIIRASTLRAEPSKRENIFQFQSLQEKMICERSSTKIIAFFRRIQMTKLKSRHHLVHKDFPITFESMKNIYADVFCLDKRDECLGAILRNFFVDTNMEDFLQFYELSKDFIWDVNVQSFSGNAELTRDCVILCRYVLYCQSEVVLNIQLLCSITDYVLRIIDNDTGVEIDRLTTEVYPRTYLPNTFGYTIVGFAWCKDVKFINWKLVIISARKTVVLFQVEELKSASYTLFDHYVPICNEIIGKHMIKLQENVIFALRFSCSYRKVKFNIKLLDPDQNVMVDMYGTEKIILPSVLLKHGYTPDSVMPSMNKSNKSLVKLRSLVKGSNSVLRTSDKQLLKKGSLSAKKIKEIVADTVSDSTPESCTYYLEIRVVDDSWPLTMDEWKMVRKLRQETYFANVSHHEIIPVQVKEAPSKSGMKSTKDSRKSVLKRVESIEKPWYLLQYAFKANAQATLNMDKRDEEEVYNLKKSWYDADPERYQKSMELRDQYLARYIDPGCECSEEYNLEVSPTISSVVIPGMTPEVIPVGPSNSREEDDDLVLRTTTSPRWTEADIPPFDLSPFYRPRCPCPLDFRGRYVKTEEDHVADRIEMYRMIEEYNASLEKRRFDLELWIDESMERRTIVSLWYADCRRASENVMAEYYIMRQNHIDKWKAEMAPPKPEKKGSPKSARKKK